MGVPTSLSRRELLGSKPPEDSYEDSYRTRHEHFLRGALRATFSLALLLSVAFFVSPSLSDIVFGSATMRLRYLAEMAGMFIGAGGIVSAAPSAFPTSGNVMWYTAPGVSEYTPRRQSRRWYSRL